MKIPSAAASTAAANRLSRSSFRARSVMSVSSAQAQSRSARGTAVIATSIGKDSPFLRRPRLTKRRFTTELVPVACQAR